MLKKIKKALSILAASALVFTAVSLPAASTAASLTKTQILGTLEVGDLFSDRDLRQEADTSDAVIYTVSDGGSVTLDSEGVYVFSGSAKEYTITVEAGDEDKVQIVLEGVSITNSSTPVIYVKTADKVFVTTASGSENALAVTGTFSKDGSVKTDGVIFSKQDLVLNGSGTLSISSSDNGIVCKDDLKVTGGTYAISCSGNGLEANDSVLICDGSITVSKCDNGIKADNDDDASLGYVIILGGQINISASGDGIKGTSVVRIDGGSITVKASEGIEATCVLINGGNISVTASDDGVNASAKSSAYEVAIVINGGDLTVSMGQGDTDALDSNGSIVINGGTVTITATSAFDYVTSGTINGGTVYVNGSQVTVMTNSMMDGGMMNQPGGFGQPGGSFGQPGGGMSQPGGGRRR